MAYFKYLPKVYVRNKTRVDGGQPYELAVNIFRRIKIRDDLQGSLLGFIQYEIQDGTRPDQVAYEVYKDAGLDWVILLVNNIINVNDDWPMNREDLYGYVQDKYGSIEGVKHYETTEYKSPSLDLVLLPSGITVSESYQYTKPDGTILTKSQSRTPVSYYDYETAVNNTKRNIYLLRPQYLTDFIAEFKRLALSLIHISEPTRPY